MGNGKRLTHDEALIRIQNKCKDNNIEFIGFDNKDNKYVNNKTHIIFKCKKCGFISRQKTYASFISSTEIKCPNCKGSIRYNEYELSEILKKECSDKNMTFLGFIEKYRGVHTHFMYKCKKCGYVGKTLTYHNFHTHNRGCIYCAKNKPYSENDLIEIIKNICKVKKLEFVKIDNFNGNKTKITVKCSKCGKYWENVTFTNFQKRDRLCPHCNKSFLEKSVEEILINCGIDYSAQKTFPWLKNNDNKKLRLDFYLPKYNIAIECQGEQHYKEVELFGGEKAFKRQKNNDLFKLICCKEHKIDLLYFGKEKSPNTILGKQIIKDKNNLIKEITSYE